MLSKIIARIKSHADKTALRILVLLLLFLNSSCFSGKSVLPTEDNLRARVSLFYNYFQNEDYGKFVEFSPNKPAMSKKDAIKYFKENYRFRIASYKIDSMFRIDELNAKVIMTMTYSLDGKEDIVTHVDCWRFTKRNWYLMTSNRTLDWQCEVRDFPEEMP